jgi:4-amino-4-deoxy-L-arabinose transferase-like glycosyltransferase
MIGAMRSRLRNADMDVRSVRIILGITIVVAVVLRVASALFQGDVVVSLPGIQDQISYHALAKRVLAGHGFSFDADWWPATRADAPTAHWSFLYTLYLAGVYAVVGAHPIVPRLIQAVIAGVLYPWFAWRIGGRLFGTHIGLVGAALMAPYLYFVYYAGSLMTETFYILALMWAFDIALEIGIGPHQQRAQAQGRTSYRFLRLWAALGLAFGLAVLLRQLVLLFLPFLALWLLWTRGTERWRSTLGGLAVSVAVIALLIAPWTVRNYRVFDRFVLLNTNAGYAFFWGNHPIHGMNFISILPDRTYQALIPPELRSLNEAAMESALMSRGIGFVTSDPVRYAVLSLSRLKDYFEFWPSAGSEPISNIARVLSFGLYLPLMVYGIWRAVRGQVLARGQGHAAVLLYLFIGVYTAIHLLSWALVRYRLPVDAVLMPFAAVGAVQLANLFGATKPLGTAIVGGVRD